MKAYVTLSPARTREHSKTPDDFVRDFYVPGIAIEFVALSERHARDAGQALLTGLYEEILARDETPYSLTMSWAIWKDGYGQAALNAIHQYMCEFIGDPTAHEVYVVVRKEQYRAWNGQYYETIVPLAVLTGEELAQTVLKMFKKNHIGLEIMKHRLLDPALAAA